MCEGSRKATLDKVCAWKDQAHCREGESVSVLTRSWTNEETQTQTHETVLLTYDRQVAMPTWKPVFPDGVGHGAIENSGFHEVHLPLYMDVLHVNF